jgi:hypothetical protein
MDRFRNQTHGERFHLVVMVRDEVKTGVYLSQSSINHQFKRRPFLDEESRPQLKNLKGGETYFLAMRVDAHPFRVGILMISMCGRKSGGSLKAEKQEPREGYPQRTQSHHY